MTLSLTQSPFITLDPNSTMKSYSALESFHFQFRKFFIDNGRVPDQHEIVFNPPSDKKKKDHHDATRNRDFQEYDQAYNPAEKEWELESLMEKD